MRKKIKVAVGLSGGVDSAVSAYLLKKHGFDVSCIYLNCYDGDPPAGGAGCRGDNDRKDALKVAMNLGLPFKVLDFRKEYQAAVIDYFKKEYLAGRTPNPDVVCNRDIKFGLFLDWAIKAGFDYLATGHYAKIVRKTRNTQRAGISECRNIREPEAIGLSDSPNFRFSGTPSFLSVPEDLHKDQTYFLWAVPREKFKRVLFPLGNLLKSEVRAIASRLAPLSGVAKKKDSAGICFVGEVRVEDFLKRLGVKEKRGEVVIRKKMATMAEMAKNGYNNSNHSNHSNHYQIIGSHRGVWFYTIGQRHGFSVDRWPPKNNTEYRMMNTEWKERLIPHSEFSIQNSVFLDRPPLYVIEKDIKKNRLVVGFGADCYRDRFVVSGTNWLIPNTEYRIPNKKNRIPDTEYRMKNSEFPARSGYAAGVAGGSIQNSVFKDCLVRIRHGGELIPCQIKMIGDHSLKIENCPAERDQALPEKLKIKLGVAQRGVAPGQSAVFYSKDGIVLGGGVIQNSYFVNKPILE